RHLGNRKADNGARRPRAERSPTKTYVTPENGVARLAKNTGSKRRTFTLGAKLRVADEYPVALSVRQPWAALLVGGIKTVEVRTWFTRRRGPVLIHASKLSDDRPEGWALITTPELTELAQLRGGIIGIGDLTDCVKYRTAESFTAAVEKHR